MNHSGQNRHVLNGYLNSVHKFNHFGWGVGCIGTFQVSWHHRPESNVQIKTQNAFGFWKNRKSEVLERSENLNTTCVFVRFEEQHCFARNSRVGMFDWGVPLFDAHECCLGNVRQLSEF